MFKLIKSLFHLIFSSVFIIVLFLFIAMDLAGKEVKSVEKPAKVVEQSNSVKVPNNEWAGRMCDLDDFNLLADCRKVAKRLGYDPNEIDEAYYTKRLTNNELGRQKSWGDYDLIVISYDMMSQSEAYQLANIVHEVIHVYTGNDICAWHKEMKRAINCFPECSYWIRLDEMEDHPIN